MDVNTSNIGACSELVVCCKLLDIGYSVFRSVSPAAPFDIVATMGKDIRIAIEIKTGKEKNGRVICSWARNNKCDCVAVVIDKTIVRWFTLDGTEFLHEDLILVYKRSTEKILTG